MEVRAATEAERLAAAERFCVNREGAEDLVRLFISGSNRYDPQDLLVAVEGNDILGVLFAQTLPARLADYALPTGSTPEIEDALLSAAISHSAHRGVRLIQSYHDPKYPDFFPVASFQRAGFQLSTRIVHRAKFELMEGLDPSYPPANSTLKLMPKFRMISEFDADVFRDTLISSLEDSLDAPEAHVGASPDEILSGYPSHNRRWLALFNGIPVGVAIFNADGAMGAIEYIGVVPQFRGQGFGTAMLDGLLRHFAGGWASVARVSVDERNIPAVRLYDRFGFDTHQTLNLWLRSVP